MVAQHYARPCSVAARILASLIPPKQAASQGVEHQTVCLLEIQIQFQLNAVRLQICSRMSLDTDIAWQAPETMSTAFKIRVLSRQLEVKKKSSNVGMQGEMERGLTCSGEKCTMQSTSWGWEPLSSTDGSAAKRLAGSVRSSSGT